MTENERRILTLLQRGDALAKGDLATKGGMGWATAVKMVARLEEQGLIVRAGTAQKDSGVLGKNAYVYGLSSSRPLVIGIDVAYSHTHLLLTNLKDEILDATALPTPARMDFEKFARFITEAVRRFGGESLGRIAGIGIGVPSRLVQNDPDLFSHLESYLTDQLATKVVVDNNIRAYTLFKQRKLFSDSDFAMVTIRTGVGFGLHIGGRLLRGLDGLAGELGHLTIVPGGARCRCGNRGCLETVVNENLLYARYVAEVAKETPAPKRATRDENRLIAGLEELFHRAAAGDKAAMAIVAEAAEHIAYALSTLVLLLNVRDIHLAAHFGTDGAIFATLVSRAMRKFVYRRIPYRVNYEPIDAQGFLTGAAMLILRDYCDYTVAADWASGR